MWLHLEEKHHIHLLFLLDKDEQEDLSKQQQKLLKALVRQLKGA